MKTLKKTLSLTLVFALVFSLMSFAFAAPTAKTTAAKLSDFTDKDQLTYTEAADYLIAAGVVKGDTDTTLNPKGDLTREQAAKMIAYACLGQIAADNLKAGSAPFTDVAADRWSAGYIAYCQKQGIINGLGDGTFNPTAKVTGYQYAKMLLCSIGYGVNGEFTGAGWDLEVAKLALSYGIFTGNTTGASSNAANREEAFLYTFNTLSNLRSVSYNKNMGVYYVPGSGALMTNPASAETDRSDTVGAVKFGMKRVGGQTGVYGEAAHYWQKDGKKVTGKYADSGVKLLASSNDGTTYAKLTTSSNSKYIGYSADSTVATFVNGDKFVALTGTASAATNVLAIGDNVYDASTGKLYTALVANASGSTVDLTDPTKATATTIGTLDGKRGVVVSFYDTNNNGKYDTVNFVRDTVAKVTSDAKAVVSGSITQVTVGGIPGLSKIDSTKVTGYEGLKKGDVVTYHRSLSGDYVITKCTTVSGVMAAFNDAAATALINGTQYKVSEINNVYNLASNKASFLGTAASTFYLDQAGFIAYAVAGSETAKLDNTLYLATTAASGYVIQGEIIKADGTRAIVNLSKVDDNAVVANDVTAINGTYDYHFYTYSVDSTGAYVLKAVTNAVYGTTYSDTKAVITKNVPDCFNTADDTPSGKLATSSTVFVLETRADTYKAYTGVANVPTYKEDNVAPGVISGALYDADGYIIFAVALNGTVDNTTADSNYIFAATPATEVYNANGNYYTYLNTAVNGEIKSMQNATGNNAIIPGKLQAVDSYDGDKVATVAASDARIGAAVYDVNDITFNGTTVSYENTGDNTADGAYVVSSDCKYFLYDVTDYNNPTLTAVTADDIEALSGDHYAIQTLKKSTSDLNTVVQMYVTVYPDSYAVDYNSVVLAAGAGADKATVNTASTSFATPELAAANKAAVVATTDHAKVKFTSANPFTAKLGVVSLITNNSPLTLTTAGAVNAELNVPVTAGDYTYAITYYTYAFVPVTVYYTVTVANT